MPVLAFAVNISTIDGKCRLVLHPVPRSLASRDLFSMHYDPAIIRVAMQALENLAPPLWDVWDRIQCPTLVLRGAESALLDALRLAVDILHQANHHHGMIF